LYCITFSSFSYLFYDIILDLLGGGGGDGQHKELKVREHRTMGVHVAGLTREAIVDEEEAIATLEVCELG
jgi:hypothetical protein